ncbi:hypothetical protein J005_06379 [Cryptococcus neoformans]|nr:hypothetical protein C344_06240 [Cryptococcus neoformans var. grubii AD1-7a]OXH23450.1 hypothetical protein J005_06379 [Cryptococcus neoformans var. grubii]
MIHLLVTGGSGYIGGEILAQLGGLVIPELQVFVTVRQDQHEVAVKEFPSGLFTPVRLDLSDKEPIKSFISENEIDVVFELTSAFNADIALPSIEALASCGVGKSYISMSSRSRHLYYCHSLNQKPQQRTDQRSQTLLSLRRLLHVKNPVR